MQLRFYSDADSGLPHIYSHDVREQEVLDILESPGEDRPGNAGSRVAIGQTRTGRYLKVIYRPADDFGEVFVITSYDLTGKPLAAYRRRQRK